MIEIVKKIGREKWIDVLKGIACICVLNGHYFDAYISKFGSVSRFFSCVVKGPLAPLFNGGLMVCIFALLSGLIISKSVGKHFSFAKRILRRYVQLGVPILVTGIVAFLFGRTGLEGTKAIPLKTALYEGTVGVLLFGKPTINPVINPAFWMMRSILIGNVLCIFLGWLCTHYNSKIVQYVTLICLIVVSVFAKDHIIMCCLNGFGIGLLQKENKLHFLKSKGFLTVLLVGSFLLMCWGHHLVYVLINNNVKPIPKNFDAVPKWLAIYSSLFVFSVNEMNNVKAFLSNALLTRIGQLSIPVFLFP